MCFPGDFRRAAARHGAPRACRREEVVETADALPATTQLFLGLGAARPLRRRQGAVQEPHFAGRRSYFSGCRAAAFSGEVVVWGRVVSRGPRHRPRRRLGLAGRGLAGVGIGAVCWPAAGETLQGVKSGGLLLAVAGAETSPCGIGKPAPARSREVCLAQGGRLQCEPACRPSP